MCVCVCVVFSSVHLRVCMCVCEWILVTGLGLLHTAFLVGTFVVVTPGVVSTFLVGTFVVVTPIRWVSYSFVAVVVASLVLLCSFEMPSCISSHCWRDASLDDVANQLGN
jgi:hypothetical protein